MAFNIIGPSYLIACPGAVTGTTWLLLIGNGVAQFQQIGQLSPSLMPTTRTINPGYTNLRLPSSSLSVLSMNVQPALSPTPWESTTESQNESLPPRIRLKKKRKPFTEFRIIREPAPHTTELRPIPNPPWVNDSDTLHSSYNDDSNTRGKGPQEENCTYGRKKSSSSSSASAAEFSTHSIIQDEDEDDIAVASAVLMQLQQQRRSAAGTAETNTFPPPARPSRKQKRYACDLCGQIFTRSGDVRRHKESRHVNSEGCRCPFCDRVLTRQDALQRHWDKYCRKKSKRHVDKQAAGETQTRTTNITTIPSTPTPASPPQTTSKTTTTTNIGIGTGLDQSRVNYRYLNIFG